MYLKTLTYLLGERLEDGSAAIILKTAVARSAPIRHRRGPCRRPKADGRQRRFLADQRASRAAAMPRPVSHDDKVAGDLLVADIDDRLRSDHLSVTRDGPTSAWP